MAQERDTPRDEVAQGTEATTVDEEAPEAVEVEAAEVEEAPPLDPEVEARRAAAMSFIRRLGDPVLKCTRDARRPLRRRRCAGQVSRMAGIMNDALGVGLAAPQLGISAAAARLPRRPGRARDRARQPRDRVGERASWRLGEEGCLSIPGSHWSTSSGRSTCACARCDEEGEERVVEASGLEARVIQHEIDHLDGVLILERTSRGRAQARAARAARS